MTKVIDTNDATKQLRVVTFKLSRAVVAQHSVRPIGFVVLH